LIVSEKQSTDFHRLSTKQQGCKLKDHTHRRCCWLNNKEDGANAVAAPARRAERAAAWILICMMEERQMKVFTTSEAASSAAAAQSRSIPWCRDGQTTANPSLWQQLLIDVLQHAILPLRGKTEN